MTAPGEAQGPAVAREELDAALELVKASGRGIVMRFGAAQATDTTRPHAERSLTFDESMNVIEQRYGDTIRSAAFDDDPGNRPHKLSCPWHGEDIEDLADDDCECAPEGS